MKIYRQLKKHYAYLIAAALLIFVFTICVFSIKDDSLTFDEVAHIPAGYSYLTQRDYRLNPEHPPLIKDLSAIPLLFLDLNFPEEHSSWTQEENPAWWFQFDFGTKFLYQSNNNPDQILFWARIPMIFVFTLLGLCIFLWTKQSFGTSPALLSLFLFCFSPTFLAHGRLVTTDIGAALGTVLSTYFWLKFLKNPKRKNIILAGLAFGFSMLLKFSLVLLLPFLAIITLVYALLNAKKKKYFPNILKYAVLSASVLAIGFLCVVLPVYQYHISNYPIDRQMRDTEFILSTTNTLPFLKNLNIAMASNPILRALGQYLLGILMVLSRSSGGNSTYFLGEISATAWKTYFPVVYAIKEPLAFHILTITALLYASWHRKSSSNLKTYFTNKVQWIKRHFTEFSMLVFIAIYWIMSLTSNLNIGVRHLLPTFPFIFILVSVTITRLLKEPYLKIKYIALSGLIIWQFCSVVAIYPHFLAYFNEIVGGAEDSYMYVTDSNLDWGQDLKRLKIWTDKNNIDKIYVDYFGGGNPEYYLKEKYMPWNNRHSANQLQESNYLAVSVNCLQGGRAEPVKGFEQPSSYYRWLDEYQPVAKIGYSIFIYKIR